MARNLWTGCGATLPHPGRSQHSAHRPPNRSHEHFPPLRHADPKIVMKTLGTGLNPAEVTRGPCAIMGNVSAAGSARRALGDRLRRLREHASYSHSDVSRTLDLVPGETVLWESGRTDMERSDVERLLELYETSPVERDGILHFYDRQMSGGVFISYRRADSAAFAGRLYDKIAAARRRTPDVHGCRLDQARRRLRAGARLLTAVRGRRCRADRGIHAGFMDAARSVSGHTQR